MDGCRAVDTGWLAFSPGPLCVRVCVCVRLANVAPVDRGVGQRGYVPFVQL